MVKNPPAMSEMQVQSLGQEDSLSKGNLQRTKRHVKVCSFFDWVVCFLMLSSLSCLNMLEINPFSVASFANIVPISVGCHFLVYDILCCVKPFKFT